MTVWYAVLAFLFVTAFVELIGARTLPIAGGSIRGFSLDKLVYVYVAGVLTFLCAFSFETGRDWGNYISMFDECEIRIKTGLVERGYIAANILFKRLGLGFWEMTCLMRMFCSLVFYRFFLKNSAWPIYTIAIYFFNYFFGVNLAQTRQYLAMAILICGLGFVKRKKLFFWVLVIILAMQFHVTAICAFPLYFTGRIRVKPWFFFAALALCLFINFWGNNLIWVLLDFTNTLSFLPQRILRILNGYMHSPKYNQIQEYSSGLGFLGRYMFYFIIAFIYIYIYNCKKYKDKSQLDSCTLNFLICILFQAMGRNFSQFSRIGYYYMLCGGGIFVWNIIPESIRFFKGMDMMRIFLSVCVVLFMLLAFAVSWINQYEYSWKTFLL